MFRLSVNASLCLAILVGQWMCCCTAALFAPAAKPVAAAEPECCHRCCPQAVEAPPCCRHESKHEKPSPRQTCCECCIKPPLAPVAEIADIEKPEPALIGFLPRPASDAVRIQSPVAPGHPPPHLSMKRFIEDFCHILRC